MAGKMAAPSPSPESTARAPDPPPVALRVRTIRLRLDAGTWSSEAGDELAAEWGLDPAAVRRHAAEAQRQREAVLDAGAAARQIEADLAIGVQMAMEAGDLNALKGLLEARLKLHGIGAHRNPASNPQVTTTTPAQGSSTDLATLPPWERAKHKEPKPS
jgi:hypothetical protein